MKLRNLLASTVLLCAALPFTANADTPGDHPAYLHALSDLRAARWMIEHRPGNWAVMGDEEEAVRRIDAAIGEIKKAAIDDGKNIDDHPPVDEHPDHPGRLHDAKAFLEKARSDVNQEEDDQFAHGLKHRALDHINGALHATDNALKATH